MDQTFIFIMAGGSGERFWPASRTTTPKHLLRLLDEQTLLEQTMRRFEGVVPLEQIFILTNSAQLEVTREAIPFLPVDNIITEPAKRDTAPACALATAIARSRSHDAVIGLFPADAMIHHVEVFRRQIKEAAKYAAESDAILTFSITPSYPSTGFGYLKLGEEVLVGNVTKLVSVSHFVEKPNSDRALEYLQSGQYGWNAGMFFWKAETFYRECERQQPELAAFIDGFPNHQEVRLDYLATAFPSLPKISVDFAIMEHANSVVAVIAEFDWDDVGSWTALPKHLGTDEFQNTFQGNVISIESTNNIVVANKRVVAICGVSDLVVVESHDAILVCHRNAAEKIKQLSLTPDLK